MTVGDLLEIAAAGAAPVGFLLLLAGLVSWIVGFGAALVVVSVVLLYLGQVWAGEKLVRLKDEE